MYNICRNKIYYKYSIKEEEGKGACRASDGWGKHDEKRGAAASEFAKSLTAVWVGPKHDRPEYLQPGRA